MKKLILAFALLLSTLAVAQSTGGGGRGGGGAITFAGVPTGTCTSTQIAVNTSNGNIYACNNGVWLLIGPGAAGSAAFNTVTAATNTGQALVIGNGSSLTVTGTGLINANQVLARTVTALQGNGTALQMFAGSAPTSGDIAKFDANGNTTDSGLLGTSVPTSVGNDTNVTGSISGNVLTLAWASTLAAARGGTGISDFSLSGTLHKVASVGFANPASAKCVEVDANGNLQIAGSAAVCGTGGAGTVTHTLGALTSGQLVIGNGAADITVGNLSGDATTSGGVATTVARINGTTVPVNSAGDQVLGTSGSATGQWDTLPSCSTASSALTYNTTTHGFACNSISSSGTVNSGTVNQIAKYASSGTAVSGDTLLSDDGTTLTYTGTGGISVPKLAVSGSNAGAVVFTQGPAQSTTANSATFQAPTSIVTGYNLTVPTAAPSASGPVVTDASGNLGYGTYTGNTTKVATSTGSLTSGNLAKWDASGNAVDDGIALTAKSGNTATAATSSGALTSGNLAKFDASGNIVDDGIALNAKSGTTTTAATTSGTLTANTFARYDDTANIVTSALSDDGNVISTTEPVDLISQPIVVEIANDTGTGTTNNKLAKLTGAPSKAVIAATTDTTGIVGIVTANGSTSGSAQIAIDGRASCVFDGATVAGDYVQVSGSAGGDCHDAGSTYPTSGQVLGRVLSTNGAGGTYAVSLVPQVVAAAGGSGYATIQDNGTGRTQRSTVNFISGSNATVSCVDNAGATKTDCTISASSSAGSRLDQISAATASNSINNGDQPQTWNWSLSTASRIGYKITENSASTATGTPVLFQVSSLTGSTANPVQFDFNGNGLRMNTSGVLAKIGTGSLDAASLSGTTATGNGGTGVTDFTFSGNTHKAATASGTLTNGNVVDFDANGNVVDSGIAATNVVTPSSSNTLTNKTYNVESSGNVFTQPSPVYLAAAGCNNAAPATFWDLPTSTPAAAACVTGTNTQKGVLDYLDTSGGFSAQYTLALPVDWTTATLPDVDLYWTTSATSGNAKWTVQFVCTDVAATATDDPAFPASSNGFNTVTTAAPGTANRVQTSTITGATVPASCASATKELLHIRVFRDGNDAADTIAATARFIGMMLTPRRAE